MLTVVQGFGAFGGLAVNPAESLVHSLARRCGPEVRTEVLPVSLDRVATEVPRLMAEHRPRVWLGVGLAAGRTALSIEAVALNLADWPDAAADADGVSVARVPVAADGPAARLTTLPVAAILAGVQMRRSLRIGLAAVVESGRPRTFGPGHQAACHFPLVEAVTA